MRINELSAGFIVAGGWPILFLVTLATFVWVATALTGHTGGPAR
jgi:hypothetical protein